MNRKFNRIFDGSPCYQCPDRWVTSTSRCHSTCAKYLEYADRQDAKRDIVHEQQNKERDIRNYEVDKYAKSRRRYENSRGCGGMASLKKR